MSTEATRYVWENARHRGPHLVLLLALAYKSKARFEPWVCDIGHAPMKKLCRLSLRRVKQLTADLVTTGHLKVIVDGGGSNSNIYQMFLKQPRPVLKADRVPVLETAPVNRDNPLTQTSRALSYHDLPVQASYVIQETPSNIVPLPEQRKRRSKQA